MASPTKITKMRRRIRAAKVGKRRKRFVRVHGTTQPMLALDEAAIQ